MEFNDTQAEAAFRAEVREFISANLPSNYGTDSFTETVQRDSPELAEVVARWRQALAARGWVAPHWPKEYGGAGLTPGEHFLLNEELALAETPDMPPGSVNMIGSTLILYGTDEQKREHLPKIASAQVFWAQGYSEPGAGSDLAGLQTRARRDGDEFVLNGQKIWTSSAHFSQWMYMLARTDPEAPKHRGISMFILPMDTPGLIIRPLWTMSRDHRFNEVFFEDARVPAKNLIGEENRGWYVGATLLDFERSNIGTTVGAANGQRRNVEMAKHVRSTPDRVLTDGARGQVVERSIEVQVALLLAYRVISMQKRGQIPNHEASANKLFGSEVSQRIAGTGVKIAGLYGQLLRGSIAAPEDGRPAESYLRSVGSTIGGGTSEIQRNVIATRGLGLPRS